MALAGPSQHGRDERSRTDLNFADRFEAMAFIEGDVLRLRRFEVRQRTFSVALSERMAHQFRPEALTLRSRIDADLRQVPMRLSWMGLFHPLERRQQVIEVFALRLQHRRSFAFVELAGAAVVVAALVANNLYLRGVSTKR